MIGLPALVGAFNNRAVQIGTALLVFFGFMAVRDHQRWERAKKEERIRNNMRALEQDKQIKENSDAFEDNARTVRANTTERVRDASPVPDYHYRD